MEIKAKFSPGDVVLFDFPRITGGGQKSLQTMVGIIDSIHFYDKNSTNVAKGDISYSMKSPGHTGHVMEKWIAYKFYYPTIDGKTRRVEEEEE